MFDRYDNQTFLFITVGSVENRNVDAKDTTINQTFLFITVGSVENMNVDAKDTTINDELMLNVLRCHLTY